MKSSSKRTSVSSINDIVLSSSGVNWAIVADNATALTSLGYNVTTSQISFDSPFQRHQGYLEIGENQYDQLAQTITSVLEDNLSAENLANVFVLLSQISCSSQFVERLFKAFDDAIVTQKEEVIKLIIDSLNDTYYAHHVYFNSQPNSSREWLDMMHAVQHFRHFNDPIEHLFHIIVTAKQTIPLRYIKKMKPLLRSVIIGWYGFNIDATESKIIEHIKTSSGEASFIAATLIDDLTTHQSAIPSWLTEKVMEILMLEYWPHVGTSLLQSLYGLTHRTSVPSDLFNAVRSHASSVMQKSMQKSRHLSNEWFDTLELVDGYISFFSWVMEEKIPLGNIPVHVQNRISTSFIGQLDNLVDSPNRILKRNGSDKLKIHALADSVYLNTCSYILLYLINMDKPAYKQLTSTCRKVKMLYYGGYEASYFAKQFTELLLVIVLSIQHLNKLEPQHEENFKSLLQSVQDTILIPYIHLTERDSEIWDTTRQIAPQAFNASKFIINLQMQKAKGKVALLDEFFEFFESVRIAEWPYERKTDLSTIVINSVI